MRPLAIGPREKTPLPNGVCMTILDVPFVADMSLGFWSQTFGTHDLLVVLLLVFFEGILSIDNAIVLGLLAKRLPKSQNVF